MEKVLLTVAGQLDNMAGDEDAPVTVRPDFLRGVASLLRDAHREIAEAERIAGPTMERA
jgi:hypothetical protein